MRIYFCYFLTIQGQMNHFRRTHCTPLGPTVRDLDLENLRQNLNSEIVKYTTQVILMKVI